MAKGRAKRALAVADQVLLHPWTTRAGGLQTVAGAGLLAAGLAGGAVTLVFGFPAVWAVLVAVGAGLLAASGTATACSVTASASGGASLPSTRRSARPSVRSWAS